MKTTQPAYTECHNCGTVDHSDYACPCGCHTDTTTESDDQITIELASPVGPRLLADASVSTEEIEDAIPTGWDLDWNCGVRTDSGRTSYPLVRATESDDDDDDSEGDDREYVEREADRIAKRVLANRDKTQSWREAGYASAIDAARVLVGDFPARRAVIRRAIELLAVEIE